MTATTDAVKAYSESQLIIVATPTDYDSCKGSFNTQHVDEVIDLVQEINPCALVLIKSTVPVGYTDNLLLKYPRACILFSPEFLREGKALYDNYYPSRVVIGTPKSRPDLKSSAHAVGLMLAKNAKKDLEDIPVFVMAADEAESVKLFANTYLALRVAFFNELDTYSQMKSMNTRSIIDAMSCDPRIGDYYNNPSFGYGGYCLPKDSKQLLANYGDTPQELMSAVVKSNETRKAHIAQWVYKLILAAKDNGCIRPIVGVYRLAMKSDSDNFRSSAILDIISALKAMNVEVMIYEPTCAEAVFNGCKVTNSLDTFKAECTYILANRCTSDLCDVEGKVLSCDVFGRD